MKKNSMLKIVNPILGILLINQVLTALLHEKLSHETFEFLHEGGGITLAVAVVIHVILNWSWIKANFFRNETTL